MYACWSWWWVQYVIIMHLICSILSVLLSDVFVLRLVFVLCPIPLLVLSFFYFYFLSNLISCHFPFSGTYFRLISFLGAIFSIDFLFICISREPSNRKNRLPCCLGFSAFFYSFLIRIQLEIHSKDGFLGTLDFLFVFN